MHGNLIGYFRSLETKGDWLFKENQNPGLVYVKGILIYYRILTSWKLYRLCVYIAIICHYHRHLFVCLLVSDPPSQKKFICRFCWWYPSSISEVDEAGSWCGCSVEQISASSAWLPFVAILCCLDVVSIASVLRRHVVVAVACVVDVVDVVFWACAIAFVYTIGACYGIVLWSYCASEKSFWLKNKSEFAVWYNHTVQ